jgi:hypothetical protein
VDDSDGSFVAPDDHLHEVDMPFIDIDDDITLLPTTLMIAVMNDDTGMIQWLLDVAGCPVDVTQPAFSESCHSSEETGELRALAFATEASMEMLLSRGADPNYATKYEIQGEHSVTREKSTLLYKCFEHSVKNLENKFFRIYGNMLEILQQTGCFNEERGITENGFSLKSTTEGQPPVIEFSLDPSIRPNKTTVHWFEDNNDWKKLFETLQIIEHRAKTMGIDLWDLLQEEDNEEDEDMAALQKYTNVFTCPTLLDENHNLCRLLIQYGADPNTYQVIKESQDDFDACIAYWPTVITMCLAKKDNAAMMNWCQQLLVHFGANPNWPIGCSPNDDERGDGEIPSGLTVLMLAVLGDNVPLARLLLEHGANPNQYEIPCGEMKDGDNEFDEELYNLKQLCQVHGYYQGLSSSSCFPTPGFQPVVGPDRVQLSSFDPGQLQSPLSAALQMNSTKMIQLLKSHGATADTPLTSVREYFCVHPRVDNNL